jgi:hypothetical protein
MLGAAMLARTGALCGRRDCLEVAASAMEYSCTRQREDGSWYYGEDETNHWIDNYHTGYNLDSLKRYLDAIGDGTHRGVLDKGLDFFLARFFREDGAPRYYHDRDYPIDIQCASQAIDTLATFSELRPATLETAVKVATWTIANMQDKDGHFYYTKVPFLTNKAPMLHWGQATMYKALAHLVTKV